EDRRCRSARCALSAHELLIHGAQQRWLAGAAVSRGDAHGDGDGVVRGPAVSRDRLVLFLPLIISSGGNAGSQATTLVVRAMALGEVKLRDWWKVIRREFIVGLALGVLLAVIGALRIIVWEGLFNSYG